MTAALHNPRTTDEGQARVIDKLDKLGYEVEDDLSVHKAGDAAEHKKDGSGESSKSSNESDSSEHDNRGTSSSFNEAIVIVADKCESPRRVQGRPAQQEHLG